MFKRTARKQERCVSMFSHKVFIVASTKNLRDVNIEEVYDGTIFTLDSVVNGYEKKLKGQNYQVSRIGDNAYIDVLDGNDELIKTYSIITKLAMLSK